MLGATSQRVPQGVGQPCPVRELMALIVSRLGVAPGVIASPGRRRWLCSSVRLAGRRRWSCSISRLAVLGEFTFLIAFHRINSITPADCLSVLELSYARSPPHRSIRCTPYSESALMSARPSPAMRGHTSSFSPVSSRAPSYLIPAMVNAAFSQAPPGLWPAMSHPGRRPASLAVSAHKAVEMLPARGER